MASISPSKPQNTPGSTLPPDFDVNRPQRGSRDGYFYLWIELNKQYGEIVNSMDDGRYDPRIYRKIRQMIATITDDSIRLYAWNLLDKTIYTIKTDSSYKTEKERHEAIMDTCDIILGEIWAFYDQFMGVTHRLRMGNTRPPDESEDEAIGVVESATGMPEPTEVIEGETTQ